MNENIKEVVDFAKSLYWTPYVWGGNFPQSGVDCGGMVCLVLRAAGVISHKDYSAQMLRDELTWTETVPRAGAIAFYGDSKKKIEHVAFCITDFLCIEAGGGDRTTRTKWEAANIRASVRLRPTQRRKDFIEVLMPAYPFEA